MNPACLEFTGLKLPEISGKMVCRDIFESDLCQGDCAIQQAIKTKQPVVGKRVNVKDKHGNRHTIIVSAGAMIDINGEVLGGFEIWRDAMPDAEMTSRLNSLMSTLYDYCQDTRELLDDALMNNIGKNEEGRRVINQLKERVGTLLKTCHSMQRSDCWSIMECPPERQVQCPAFPNHGRNCWDIDYTWCNGQMQGDAPAKVEKCSQCVAHRELRNQN
jgi:PAS domain S-box-containing protein